MKDEKPCKEQLFTDYSIGFGNNDNVIYAECSPDDGCKLRITNGSSATSLDYKEVFSTWLSWSDVITNVSSTGYW